MRERFAAAGTYGQVQCNQSKKLNKGSTLDVLHTFTDKALSNRETYFPARTKSSSMPRCQQGDAALFFHECWRSNFHQTNLKPETLQQPASSIISSLQSNNRYERCWSDMEILVMLGEIIGALMVAHVYKKCIFCCSCKTRKERASNNLGNNLPH